MQKICEYEIRVRGTETATETILDNMPLKETVTVLHRKSAENQSEIFFKGICDVSVNFAMNDELTQEEKAFMKTSDNSEVFDKCRHKTLRVKSLIFGCEIAVHYRCEDSGFDSFYLYLNGETLKKRRIEYDTYNEFDWKTLEFSGHQGEFDMSADGEEADLKYLSRLDGVMRVFRW